MRRAAYALVAAALLAACAGEPTGPRVEGAMPAASVELPAPGRDVPLYVVSVAGDGDALAAEALSVPGVRSAAVAELHDLSARTPEGRRSVRVAGVDPLDYRSLAPPEVEDAEFVWASLLAGQMSVTSEAAERWGLDHPAVVRVAGIGRMAIGSVTDHAVPNFADALVDRAFLDRAPARSLVILGGGAGVDRAGLRRALEQRWPDAPTRPLIAEPEGALAVDAPEDVTEEEVGPIASMTYRAIDDGFIRPERAWVERNIVTADVPILGEVDCHRLLVPQLEAALDEIVGSGLTTLIDPGDYGGCYVPRFIDRDPSMPLSMHAFGLAFDINVSTNQLGTPGDLDPRVVEIFERWGFRWGGHWSRPDPMHFELERLLPTPSSS